MHQATGRERLTAPARRLPEGNTPERFAESVRNDVLTWTKIVTDTAIERDRA